MNTIQNAEQAFRRFGEASLYCIYFGWSVRRYERTIRYTHEHDESTFDNNDNDNDTLYTRNERERYQRLQYRAFYTRTICIIYYTNRPNVDESTTPSEKIHTSRLLSYRNIK